VADTDIDGAESRPFQLDSNVPMLGKYTASRRVARSIFIGSAPSVAAQTVRGVEEVRIRLATVQPGEPPAVFGDALKRLTNRLMYLYNDSTRYWYDTRPTVNRLARDRAQRFPEDEVIRAVHERLRAVRRQPHEFAGVHVAPSDSADVADEQRVRVVVLPVNCPHKRATPNSPAMAKVKEIFEKRGNAPRLYRNMLVFIAADEQDAEALKANMRELLAWQSIHNEEEQLNLDAQQRKQVETNLQHAQDTVEVRVRSTYNWLIIPTQRDSNGEVELEETRINGEDSFYSRAFRRMEQNGEVITTWAPTLLSMTIRDFNLWQGGNHLSLKRLWEALASYCYMPRLLDREVLVDAVAAGVRQLVDTPFGYADRYDESTGRYERLLFGSSDAIYFNDSAVLVHPEAAKAQIEAERPEPVVAAKPDGDGRPDHTPPPLPSKLLQTRYHGSVQLDAQRLTSQVDQIVDEILQHLTSLTGCEVRVSLEVHAWRREGFDEATLRTVTENSRTLKFDTFGFERD